LYFVLQCQNPGHKEHLKNFIRKYPSAKDRVPDTIITVNPEDWAIDLEHPEKNTVKCCKMCSIQEDIKRARSPDRRNEPETSIVLVNGRQYKIRKGVWSRMNYFGSMRLATGTSHFNTKFL